MKIRFIEEQKQKQNIKNEPKSLPELAGNLAVYRTGRKGFIDMRSAVSVLMPLAKQIETAHDSGETLPSLRPETIDIQDRTFKLNKAAYLYEGVIFPGFSAPEVYSGTTHGIPTDIYSFSAVLYYLVTGLTPEIAFNRLKREDPLFSDELFDELKGARSIYVPDIKIEEDPFEPEIELPEPLPVIPDDLIDPVFVGILEKGMALDAADRYENISEMIAELSPYDTKAAIIYPVMMPVDRDSIYSNLIVSKVIKREKKKKEIPAEYLEPSAVKQTGLTSQKPSGRTRFGFDFLKNLKKPQTALPAPVAPAVSQVSLSPEIPAAPQQNYYAPPYQTVFSAQMYNATPSPVYYPPVSPQPPSPEVPETQDLQYYSAPPPYPAEYTEQAYGAPVAADYDYKSDNSVTESQSANQDDAEQSKQQHKDAIKALLDEISSKKAEGMPIEITEEMVNEVWPDDPEETENQGINDDELPVESEPAENITDSEPPEYTPYEAGEKPEQNDILFSATDFSNESSESAEIPELDKTGDEEPTGVYETLKTDEDMHSEPVFDRQPDNAFDAFEAETADYEDLYYEPANEAEPSGVTEISGQDESYVEEQAAEESILTEEIFEDAETQIVAEIQIDAETQAAAEPQIDSEAPINPETPIDTEPPTYNETANSVAAEQKTDFSPLQETVIFEQPDKEQTAQAEKPVVQRSNVRSFASLVFPGIFNTEPAAVDNRPGLDATPSVEELLNLSEQVLDGGDQPVEEISLAGHSAASGDSQEQNLSDQDTIPDGDDNGKTKFSTIFEDILDSMPGSAVENEARIPSDDREDRTDIIISDLKQDALDDDKDGEEEAKTASEQAAAAHKPINLVRLWEKIEKMKQEDMERVQEESGGDSSDT